MLFSRRLFLRFIVPAAVVIAIVAACPLWLGALGAYLVRAEEPERADIAVVLAGDFAGNRILKAAELVRQGYVTKILVSGPAPLYGRAESDFAVSFAVQKGCPAYWFISFPIRAYSTTEEARAIVPELRRRNVKRFLIVTSNYHTRRAGNEYRKLSTGMEFRAVAASDDFFTADGWWRSREGRKRFLLEWMKTVAGWMPW